MMEDEYTTKTSRGGTLMHRNVNYAHAYERQDNGLTSSSYLASSTSPYSTPMDGPTAVLAPTEASANTAIIISITALPPLNTIPPHDATKLPYHQHLNVIFLAPLFAVLGILLGVGAVSLWWRFRLFTGSGICGLGGRKNGSGSRITLEPGPAYAPAPSDEGDGGVNDVESSGPYPNGNRSMEEVTLFAAGTPSKTTVHGTRFLFPTHMRGPATSGGAVTKPLCTPFLMGASRFDSAGNGGSDRGDPFISARCASSSSRTHDPERADVAQPRRSVFHRLLNRSTSATGRQYAAVRTHDSSPSTHSRLNPTPISTPNINHANTLNSTASHGGRSSAVDVPLRSLEGGAGGEVQRPVRAWLETPEGMVETPGGTRYGDGKARKHTATGGQDTGYAPVTDTPRTPVSRVSQFWTPRWKNKAPPLLSSPSPAKPSPSTLYMVRSPSQTTQSQSPSPNLRSAVSSAGLRSAISPLTHEGPSKARKEQDLRRDRLEDIEKGTESEPKLLEHSTSIPHIDSSVLPRSPPFLMSPPLEAALLFTSTSCGALSFATLANLSPKLGSRSPPSKATVYGGTYDSPLSSKTKTKANLGLSKVSNVDQSAHVTSPDISLFPLPSSARKLKKPRNRSRSRKERGKGTNRGPETSPMLPFPSYPDHLVRAGQKTSVSMTLASSASQPAISPTPTMLAIFAATQSLERVNEILLRGYSERALGGGDMEDEERMLREDIVAAGIESSGH
ncbi:hypothetical protein DEU56DRAFT_63652 [Suillus clintonianus]|uniref:uncharacterized protein n=1 Tax=Suillus clintonianus TaxID=1904413 RepID=UPI001B883CC0|nr:uncharacterized protein DEU56DRAFT_63652 [Suillus clintonianus]KAG2123222.1 hypothetical protein DEU56DRAFT_63652 [Suillus clintonianus]